MPKDIGDRPNVLHEDLLDLNESYHTTKFHGSGWLSRDRIVILDGSNGQTLTLMYNGTLFKLPTSRNGKM
jgi:hypothetical protein